MSIYAIYNSEGKIRYCVSGVDIEDQIDEGQEYIEIKSIIDTEEYYVSGSKLLLKKDYSLETLPLPCIIEIEDQTYEVTEQPEFEFDIPGTYTIRVMPDSPQYLEKEFEYVVEA